MPKNTDSTNKKNALFVSFFFAIGCIFIIIFLLFMFFRSNWYFFSHTYITYYDYGSDIKEGTVVTLNGIKVGEVKKVEIDALNRIKVNLTVIKKYKNKIKKDSIAKIVRPLLIGSKQINISAGSISAEILPPGHEIISEDSSELIDLISGRSLQNFIEKLGITSEDKLNDELNKISVRDIYDKAISSLVSMNELRVALKDMSGSMRVFSESIENMSVNMSEMGKSLESMKELNGSMGELGDGMKNMSDTFEKLSSSLSDFGPLSEKIVPILDNVDIILEAVQINSLFKKDVEKVKKEKEKNN